MLTRKQQELLNFINSRLTADGISPSFDEMKDALKLKSKSGIHRLISGLEERGFIRRLPHRARALEVTRLPESVSVRETVGKAISSAKEAGQKISRAVDQTVRTLTIPMLGRIAAGTAIEALRENDRTMEIPAVMLGTGDHYVLEVAGDSMVEAGIHDGDTVVIQQCDHVNNGDVAVALIDEQGSDPEKLLQKGNVIDLVPANSNYKTMTYPVDRVRVQGRLVGLLRKY